jgi:hypothetical protein
MSAGVEKSSFLLKQLLELTLRSRDMGAWLRVGVLASLVAYLDSKEPVLKSVINDIILLLDRLVAFSENAAHSR